MNDIIGYIITILVGITLGLMGSGGSILTVPNLVYLFDINTVQATTYSLFIIGITSLIGSYDKIKNGLVNFRLVIIFGIPSLLAMIVTRIYILKFLPQQIYFPYLGVISKDIYLIFAFAIVMIFAAYSMITNKQEDCIECGKKMEKKTFLLLFQGIIIGTISGIFGAGGGFLIIPGLVVFAKVPMKNAVATSLFLVAINSIIGFTSDFQQFNTLNWTLLLSMTILSIIGIVLGNYFVRYVDASKLKPYFGYFILFIASLILIQEFVLNS